MEETNREQGFKEKNSYLFARWMSWLFMGGSILVLIYTYHRAEIIYQGEMGPYYFRYYVISLLGVLFWGVVLRLREEVQAYIITAAISMAVGLYVVEGALIFFNLGSPKSIRSHKSVIEKFKERAVELGREFDDRTNLEVINDLRNEGVDAVPVFAAAHMANSLGQTVVPLTGLSNKTTVGSNEGEKHLLYKSDRYGYNNPDSQWDSPTMEYLLTGDSYIHGASVPTGKEIAGQIRSMTNDSVISLGNGGNGPLFELASLTEYGGLLKPKKVIWFYFEANDFQDLFRESQNPLMMQYLEDGFSQNLINRKKEIENLLREYIEKEKVKAEKKLKAVKVKNEEIRFNTDWITLNKIRRTISFDTQIAINSEIVLLKYIELYPLFVKILSKAKARTEAWGGKLYFVYLPEYTRYRRKKINHDRFQNKSKVIDMVNNLNIPVIDIHQEVFVDHPDPFSLFPMGIPGGHYNSDGFSKVAKAVIANSKN